LKILAFNMFFSLLVSSTKARPRKGRAPVTGGVSVFGTYLIVLINFKAVACSFPVIAT
jgi:hypothetical protein